MNSQDSHKYVSILSENLIQSSNWVDRIPSIKSRTVKIYYLLGVFIFYIWYQAIANVHYEGTLLAYHNLADFCIGTTIGFSMIFLLFLFNTLIIVGIRWHRGKIWRIGFNLVLSQVSPLLTNGLFIAVSFLLNQHPHIRWIEVYLINFMIFIIIEVVWFISNFQYIKRLYEINRRVSIQLEHYALRSQVNPHFLFNSLNTLYSLMHIDIRRSQEFVLSISKMYRYIMAKRDEAVIPLKDELIFLNSYIEVLKILYYDCFFITIVGEERVTDQHIIPFSLQLLIENVTKHNVINHQHPMRVAVKIGDRLLTVTNSISRKKEFPRDIKGAGIGLLYLTELYRFHGSEFKYEDNAYTFTAYVPYLPSPKKNSND